MAASSDRSPFRRSPRGNSSPRPGWAHVTSRAPLPPKNLDRAAALAAKIERFNILIDSEPALRAIEETKTVFDVFLKVDCGYHRAGVDPDRPARDPLATSSGAQT